MKREHVVIYWTLAILALVIVALPATITAGLVGFIILLPTIPAAPAVAYAWRERHRIRPEDLSDIDDRPPWLP